MSNKIRGVSLGGRTRLTYRQAFALVEVAYAGIEDLIDAQSERSLAVVGVARKALDKLKDAIDKAGGYDRAGDMIDPFGSLDI